MKKLMVAVFSAVCAGAGAFAANMCTLGGNAMTFDAAIAAVRDATDNRYADEMIVFTEDVTSNISITNIGDWNFAGFNLNGHNFTYTSYDLIGKGDNVEFVYPKTFDIPEGSTFLVTSGQPKICGSAENHVKFRIGGTLKSSRSTYSFKFQHTDIEFTGPSPKLQATGEGAYVETTYCNITFNMEGLTAPYAEPPIELTCKRPETQGHGKYAFFKAGSTTTFSVINADQMLMHLSAPQTVTMVSLDENIPGASGGLIYTPAYSLPNGVTHTTDLADKPNIETFTFTPVTPAAAVCYGDGSEKLRYRNLGDALSAAVSGDAIKLLSDVTYASYFNIGAMDFAEFDLNGFNLKISNEFRIGDDSNGAQYGKVLKIPVGSTLEVTGQTKINGGAGRNSSVIIGGTFLDSRNAYSFVFKNIDVTFKGAEAQLLATGAQGAINMTTCNITIDLDGVTSVPAEPFMYAPNVSEAMYGDGFNVNTSMGITILNYNDLREAVSDSAEVVLVQTTPEAANHNFYVTLTDDLPAGCAIRASSDRCKSSLFLSPRYVCAIGETKYETLDAAVAVAGSSDTIRLVCNFSATEAINWTNAAFGGFDLNGFNLTLNGDNSNFYCGDDSHIAASAKVITVPSGSTLSVGGQIKLRGSAAEPVKLVVAGTVIGRRGYYGFSATAIEIDLKGASPLISATGEGGMCRAIDCDLVFDFDGVSSWYANAPFQATAVTQTKNDSGMNIAGNSTVTFLNDEALRAGISSETDCLVAIGTAENSVIHKFNVTSLPEGVTVKKGTGDDADNFYFTIAPALSNIVDVDGLMVTITDDALANVFGGAMPSAADLKAIAANGYKVFEDYILGIDPTSSSVKPLVNFREASAADKLALGVENVEVRDGAGVTVSFTLKSDTEVNGSFSTVEAESSDGEFEIELPEDKATFYKVGIGFAN